MDMELDFIQIKVYIKGNIKIILKMDMVWNKIIKQVKYIKEIMYKVLDKEQEN